MITDRGRTDRRRHSFLMPKNGPTTERNLVSSPVNESRRILWRRPANQQDRTVIPFLRRPDHDSWIAI